MVETANNVSKNQLRRHVVVLSFPFGTHSVPTLNLVRRLALAAPTVTFSFFSTSKSNLSVFGSKSGYQVLSNLKAYDVGDGVPEDYQLTGKPFEEVEFFIKSMADNFRKAIDDVIAADNYMMMTTMNEEEEEEVGSTTTTQQQQQQKKKIISCVMSTGFLGFAGEMAEEMGVPWINLWTAGTFALSIYYYIDVIRQSLNLGQNGNIAGREDEPIDIIPALSVLHVKDLPAVLIHDFDSIFSRMLYQGGQMVPRASAIILNTFEELEYPPILDDLKSISKNILTLGPFSLPSSKSSQSYYDDPKYDCINWLDTQKPTSVVFVGFGTVATPPPHELAALAEGLEESGAPFLWSLKEGLMVHLPSGFLERTSGGKGLVVGWAPQQEILEHVAIGVFVTHCGWNSVMESLMAGVPMIGRPMFGDHMVDCRMVTDVWGVGIRIKDGIISKDGLMEGLDLILYSEEGKKIREKAGALRGIIKHVMGPKGSSTRNFNTFLEMICRD